MSFTIHCTSSSNYRSLGSVQSVTQPPARSGQPLCRQQGLRLPDLSISCSISFWGPGHRIAGGLAGVGGIQAKKETMQDLNDLLASYLARGAWWLIIKQEVKIQEHLEKGLQARGWGHCLKTIRSCGNCGDIRHREIHEQMEGRGVKSSPGRVRTRTLCSRLRAG
ncbi:Keratin, type I cytoskeletal 18 [Vulpes lagopus]